MVASHKQASCLVTHWRYDSGGRDSAETALWSVNSVCLMQVSQNRKVAELCKERNSHQSTVGGCICLG